MPTKNKGLDTCPALFMDLCLPAGYERGRRWNKVEKSELKIGVIGYHVSVAWVLGKSEIIKVLKSW